MKIIFILLTVSIFLSCNNKESKSSPNQIEADITKENPITDEEILAFKKFVHKRLDEKILQ